MVQLVCRVSPRNNALVLWASVKTPNVHRRAKCSVSRYEIWKCKLGPFRTEYLTCGLCM
jgi:hypothetical protein